MQWGKAVNLIVIDPSDERVEGLASFLRNRGLPVQPQPAMDARQLQHLLSLDTDLLLYNADASDIPLVEISEIYRASGCRAPMIALAERPGAILKREAIEAGIRDIVSASDTDHLDLVVRRELANLGCRRELDQAARRLKELDQRCASLIASSRDAICYLQEGVFTQVNTSCLALFGYHAPEEIIGLPLLDMISLEEQDNVKPVFRAVMLGQQSAGSISTHCLRRDGSEFEAQLELSRFELNGEPSIQLRIQKKRKPAGARPMLSIEAHRDADTGLFNRHYFLQQLDHRIEEGNDESNGTALLYIEIDGFRNIRRQIGLEASDRLLKTITSTLLQTARPEELLARFGDCSFALLADRDNAFALNTLAEQICTSVAKIDFSAAFESIRPTCSIGISILSKAAQHHKSPMDLALHACELAEEHGGNQFIFNAGDEHEQEINNEEVIPNSLIHSALAHNRFRLTYQPVVSLHGDTTENFLVLLRLLDDEDTEIPAGSFLKQVEYAGLMDVVDRWVIEHSIMELARLHREGRQTRFFVTLAGASLKDQDLPLWINEKLQQYNAKGGWLTFQMHEQDVRNLFDKATHFFEDLKHIGCQLAIDRFGLQPEPESLLHHLGLDYVRLDPSFMRGLPDDTDKQEQLAILHDRIQHLDIKIIAASVEDARSLSVLWKLGVSHIQGHFLQAPSPSMTYDFQHA